MAERIRQRLTYANVMSTIACFGVLAGGTAYAANTVFSGDIVDGEVKSADLANAAVTNAKLADNSVGKPKISAGAVGTSKLGPGAATNAKIADGAVNSAKVQNGTLTGTDIDESLLDGRAIPGAAVRAYGYVAADGTVTRSKNVVGDAILRFGDVGIYCITLDPSIDASEAVIVPETDYDFDTSSAEGPSTLAWAKSRSLARSGENESRGANGRRF